MPNVRLLPTQSLSGPENMAVDEVMLETASERGLASLRFYTWREPTLSLGYFQPTAMRLADPRLVNLAWVRRPSGGGAILHHHELTYCLALPSGSPWQSKESWICRMHHVVTTVLQSFGVSSRGVVCGEEKKIGDFLCFLHQTPADLLIASAKITGSAQRKWRGALMQHGSIILRQSPHAPAVTGIQELSGISIDADELARRLGEAIRKESDWELKPDLLTPEEQKRVAEIEREKYRARTWNEKR